LSYPAPAAIIVEQPRRYGAVPGIGARGSPPNETTKAKRP
jgi:hypothetical protein